MRQSQRYRWQFRWCGLWRRRGWGRSIIHGRIRIHLNIAFRIWWQEQCLPSTCKSLKIDWLSLSTDRLDWPPSDPDWIPLRISSDYQGRPTGIKVTTLDHAADITTMLRAAWGKEGHITLQGSIILTTGSCSCEWMLRGEYAIKPLGLRPQILPTIRTFSKYRKQPMPPVHGP